MLVCFVCRIPSDTPELLFEHIKRNHKKSPKYQCTEQTCVGMKFSDFSAFKKHVLRCFGKRSVNEELPDPIIPAGLFVYAIDNDVLQFKSGLNRGALELVCSLSAQMNTPRGEVYTTIDKVKSYYLTKLIAGSYTFSISFMQLIINLREMTSKHLTYH